MLKDFWVDSERRNLGIILIILVLIALVFGSLVIWAAFRKPYVDPITLSPHAWEGMTEEDKLRIEVWDKTDEVDAKMVEILKQDKIDVDEVNRIYNEAIELALENKQEDYIIKFLVNRNSELISKGMVNEALDALLSSDLENILEIESNLSMMYRYIVSDADIAGRDDIMKEYQDKIKYLENNWVKRTEEVINE